MGTRIAGFLLTAGILLVAGACLMAVTASTAGVSVFGHAGRRLTSDDLDAITNLAGGQPLLAVEVDQSQVLPEAWLAVAYARPETEAGVVRRGRAIDLKSFVERKRATTWKVTAREGRYAQVTLAGRPFPAEVSEAVLDRPFRVIGSFADRELAELIAWVRSSPRKSPIPDSPDGRLVLQYPAQIDGRLPLVEVERIDRSHVRVRLTDNNRSGQLAKLRYQIGRWLIDEFSFYNA